jgi:hypothetical protein
MQRGEVEDLEVHAEVVAGADRPGLAQASHDFAHVGGARCAGHVVHRLSSTLAIRFATMAGV